MLATKTDRASLNRMAKRDALDIDDLRRVYGETRRAARGPWAILDPSTLVTLRAGEDPDDVPDPRIALNLLEEGGLVHRHPDAPVNWTLWPARERAAETVSPLWERLSDWLNLDSAAGAVTFETAEASASLECSPGDLSAAIAEAPGWRGSEGPRLACLELAPTAGAGRDSAGSRVNQVLLNATRRAQRRIARVIDYQAGRECRHVLLARHLGELIDPCGTACDVCDHAADMPAPGATAPRARTVATADDVAAVIRGVASLQYPVGRARLIQFLQGSPESRIRPGQSPQYGVLADLRKSRIDAVITRLLEADLLVIDPDDEYKVIHAAPGSAGIEPEELAPYADAPSVRAPSRERTPAAGSADEVQLDPEGEALYDQLAAWRRERAARDGLPAFAIATNRALAEIATRRPRDESGLASISLFGATRAGRYAAEMLPILRGEA
jgi:hypothetical protein